MIKGAGPRGTVSGIEEPPRRPTLPSEPSSATTGIASTSRKTRSFSTNTAFGAALEAYKTLELQYQTRCHLVASLIYSSLTVEERQHLGGAKKPREMWETLKSRLCTLSRDIGTARVHTAFHNDKMIDTESLSSYIAGRPEAPNTRAQS